MDRAKHLQGLITADLALEARKGGIASLREVKLIEVPVHQETVLVQDIFTIIAESKTPLAVIDEEQRLIGIIIRGSVLAALADIGGDPKDVSTTIGQVG